jgi:copper chaperone
MENRTFSIPNISCGHCVMTIKNELRELVGVKHVEGDTENKAITVEWESPTTLQEIQDTLIEINYPAS